MGNKRKTRREKRHQQFKRDFEAHVEAEFRARDAERDESAPGGIGGEESEDENSSKLFMAFSNYAVVSIIEAWLPSLLPALLGNSLMPYVYDDDIVWIAVVLFMEIYATHGRKNNVGRGIALLLLIITSSRSWGRLLVSLASVWYYPIGDLEINPDLPVLGVWALNLLATHAPLVVSWALEDRAGWLFQVALSFYLTLKLAESVPAQRRQVPPRLLAALGALVVAVAGPTTMICQLLFVYTALPKNTVLRGLAGLPVARIIAAVACLFVLLGAMGHMEVLEPRRWAPWIGAFFAASLTLLDSRLKWTPTLWQDSSQAISGGCTFPALAGIGLFNVCLLLAEDESRFFILGSLCLTAVFVFLSWALTFGPLVPEVGTTLKGSDFLPDGSLLGGMSSRAYVLAHLVYATVTALAPISYDLTGSAELLLVVTVLLQAHARFHRPSLRGMWHMSLWAACAVFGPAIIPLLAGESIMLSYWWEAFIREWYCSCFALSMFNIATVGYWQDRDQASQNLGSRFIFSETFIPVHVFPALAFLRLVFEHLPDFFPVQLLGVVLFTILSTGERLLAYHPILDTVEGKRRGYPEPVLSFAQSVLPCCFAFIAFGATLDSDLMMAWGCIMSAKYKLDDRWWIAYEYLNAGGSRDEDGPNPWSHQGAGPGGSRHEPEPEPRDEEGERRGFFSRYVNRGAAFFREQAEVFKNAGRTSHETFSETEEEEYSSESEISSDESNPDTGAFEDRATGRDTTPSASQQETGAQSMPRRSFSVPHTTPPSTAAEETAPPPKAKQASCASCGRTGSSKRDLKKCAVCKSVYYCSRECQRKDWKSHRQACGKR